MVNTRRVSAAALALAAFLTLAPQASAIGIDRDGGWWSLFERVIARVVLALSPEKDDGDDDGRATQDGNG